MLRFILMTLGGIALMLIVAALCNVPFHFSLAGPRSRSSARRANGPASFVDPRRIAHDYPESN